MSAASDAPLPPVAAGDVDPVAFLTAATDAAIAAAGVDAAVAARAPTDPVVSKDPKFGDYQVNAALPLAKMMTTKENKVNPKDLATKIMGLMDVGAVFEAPSIAGPGFINFTLRKDFIAAKIKNMLLDADRLGLPKSPAPQKIVVDFSSPNIAKEMHVGHLRSTIIGDSIARVLEFLGHDVLRLNHVGDWGTQFGMLILHLKETCPAALEAGSGVDIGDLVEFYKASKKRFDEDEVFKAEARKEVVELQSGNPDSLKAWNVLCDCSRKEFQVIYNILDVKLGERGESFYNPYLPAVIEHLKEKQLAVEDDGAMCVFLEGFLNREGKPQPLLVQKSDGGFMYATTDLAAIRYRIGEDKATRVLYVTDIGQSTHFEQVFQVAKRADMIPEGVSLEHVPFGLVQGEDGKKFKTRSGDTVKLIDLLDEAVSIAKQDLLKRIAEEGRTETEEFINANSQTVGIAAVKYADLKNNRTTNYRFSYAKMLSLQGNTAPYMLYAFARVQGIYRKAGVDVAELAREGKLAVLFTDEAELALCKHLMRLPAVLGAIEAELKPSILCEYMFELSTKFNQFYERCSVVGAESEELKLSRLALCETTARTLDFCLGLLGIQTVDRI